MIKLDFMISIKGPALAKLIVLYQAVNIEPGSLEIFLPNAELMEIYTFSGKASP